MNSKKIVIISLMIVLCIALVSGVAAYAMTNNLESLWERGSKLSEKETGRNHGVIARVDSIESGKITLTLGEKPDKLEKKANSDKQPQENSSTLEENFKEADQKVTLTIPESVDISTVKIGDIVTIRYNDQNELLSIYKASKGEPKENYHLGIVDNISNNQVTLSLLQSKDSSDKKDSDSSSNQSNPIRVEHKTFTVENTEILNDLKVDDKIFFEVSSDNENMITDIRKIGKEKETSQENRQVARIDQLNGVTITLTLGELKSTTENSTLENDQNPTDSFTAGNEQKTYTVKDSEDLSGLKVGDIVFFKVDENDENVLTMIQNINEHSQKDDKIRGKTETPENKNTGNNSPNQTEPSTGIPSQNSNQDQQSLNKTGLMSA